MALSEMLASNSPAEDHGVSAMNNILTEANSVSSAADHDIVLRNFRVLIADLCQQFNGGHPGGAIGMAAIGLALYKYVMKYDPKSPSTFFNRDRFVLSNGHTCLFQYCFLHLTGNEAMTLDQLKSYHSDRVDGLCAGHPEIEVEGIEVTTGPLGQGVANSVGLAMATKNLAATYNKPGFDLINNHTWCMIGDACLQEGVALEAISFAGHLKLNNLTIIYDNNQITCDGSVDLTNTEDVNAKMIACGWDVIDIEDGCYDVPGLVKALLTAKKSQKPTFINVRTVIGVGSAVAGKADAHGQAFGVKDVANIKQSLGFSPEEHFVILPAVYKFFEDLSTRGERLIQDWDDLLTDYGKEYPVQYSELKSRIAGRIPAHWRTLVPNEFPDQMTATRKANGLVFNPIAKDINSFLVGTADLSPSVNMIYPDKIDFQHPELKTQCGIRGNYSGRYIHYGVREHAMAAISNGLAAFAPGCIIPVTSSFFIFYIYAAPAVRMGALQHLQVIHVATHDSIGMGEDGPTHQPIELAALYRAMPNLLFIRPGDSEETAGAWIAAIEAKHTPSIISTSRHTLPQYKWTRREGVLKGAYVLFESYGDDETNSQPADITLIGVGAELTFAVEVAQHLKAAQGLRTRVVSFPCQRLFERQPIEYKRSVLQRHTGTPAIVIEAYAANGWERYSDAAFSMKTFGKSLPGKVAYKYFGYETESISARILAYLQKVKEDPILGREFQEL